MIEQLESVERRYCELEEEIGQPEVATDPRKLQALAQERSGLEKVVTLYRRYRDAQRQLEDTRQLLASENDEDLLAMARQEAEVLSTRQAGLLAELKKALLPRDPNDEKSIIMEIRAGTGGDEAGLFAGELFKMYTRYAQTKGWRVDIIELCGNNIGSVKEAIFEINGRGAFSRLKYERGVHRVQRVPLTEAAGRIHTSTATVAVLPQAEEVDVRIKPEDLKIDVFHSSGAGGQNVQKVATAVRVTHLPTGLVVTCQDERSQLRNKSKALGVLRARLLDAQLRKQEEERTSDRRSQVGSGERSEKIRTYNFPQDRLTDHRTGLSLHNLPRLMDGDLDELIDAIASSEEARLLEGAPLEAG